MLENSDGFDLLPDGVEEDELDEDGNAIEKGEKTIQYLRRNICRK
jgi:hypothetical protein